MSGRLLFVLLLLSAQFARGGTYQLTKNGKARVWNNNPKAGDEATWSGGHDADGYARGFGNLNWFTREAGFRKPQLYARYWGNMSDGKFNGPVNVHSKRKTHHAIFVDGARMTRWAAGPAPSRMNARWRAAIARQRIFAEPESPAQGPGRVEEIRSAPPNESIRDLTNERWPKIDIDDSLRVLAWPPRALRIRRDDE